MASPLEDALLRGWNSTRGFRSILLDYLDDGVSLGCFRLVSRKIHDIVDRQPGRLFRSLYIQAPIGEDKDVGFLKVIAKYCQRLTITIGDPNMAASKTATPSNNRPPRCLRKLGLERKSDGQPEIDSRNSMPSFRTSLKSILSSSGIARASVPPAGMAYSCFPTFEKLQALQAWNDLLKRFRQLSSLTLRVYGHTGWDGRKEAEETLMHIRVAVERGQLSELHTLKLIPIHATGIIHMLWSDLNAFHEALPIRANIWTRIQTLDLRIKNPTTLSEPQMIMFKKLLYIYLNSFAPSLRCLRFVWQGNDGPSPLALHLEHGLQHRAPIVWPRLKELWLGNITHPHRTIRLIPELAPAVILVKSLRSTHRDSFDAHHRDSSAWMEILIGKHTLPFQSMDDRGSSVYSGRSERLTEAWAGGISRTSKELPFVLDLGRRASSRRR